MLMPFTPESGRNLRSLVIALQDPGNYGRLISLQIPQGMFVPGPEEFNRRTSHIDEARRVTDLINERQARALEQPQ